jgi:hypothetical protein
MVKVLGPIFAPRQGRFGGNSRNKEYCSCLSPNFLLRVVSQVTLLLMFFLLQKLGMHCRL